MSTHTTAIKDELEAFIEDIKTLLCIKQSCHCCMISISGGFRPFRAVGGICYPLSNFSHSVSVLLAAMMVHSQCLTIDPEHKT